LYAHDEEGTAKTFLLRRIVSPVKPTGKTFEAPTGNQTEIALSELEDVWNSHVAIVEVVPATEAESRLSKRRGTTVAITGELEVHYSDVNIFADELAGYGAEVLVVSPPELRAGVIARLERTAADHG
jgi:proteasome accessory factor B